MKIKVGYELIYECPQPTPMMLVLNIHYTRASDLLVPDHVITDPSIPIADYRDSFGNWCTRLVAPTGQIRITSTASRQGLGRAGYRCNVCAAASDTGAAGRGPRFSAWRAAIAIPKNFCRSLGTCSVKPQTGWGRVQAICDFVHNHISFGYEHASATRTAWETFQERRGVCRDFAHLAIALCRCMNIPARYCTGYLGDIGIPPPYGRWTSPPGSRRISEDAGIRSIRATTFRGSGEY